MLKKSFILFISALFITSLSCICFATDNVVNDVKNAVNDTTNSAQNALNNPDGNSQNDMMNNKSAITNNNDYNNNYNAVRTSTSGENTLLGMNSTMWTWIILAIAAIAIIALIWYFLVQSNKQNYDEH